MNDPSQVAVRPAATVLLVRDGNEGLDVFMVRRTMAAAFASGMYVFPGGRVDPADSAPEMQELCAGLGDAEASELLGVTSGGLAYWVAAIRECFEEAGVLLARHADSGQTVRFDSDETIARFGEYRHRVHDGELSLLDLCAAENLRLATDAIHYISHWVTPIGETRRFDTRFFMARAPEAQDPLHDDKETIDSLWVRPADAFARHAAGDLALLPPTLSNLQFVGEHADAEAAMAAARRVGVPPRIQPRLRFEDGRLTGILMPGDPGFDELPGD